ncbi:hypothetical protein D1610_11535 [Sphingomonas gilva]|uniref:Transposase n=1 Tax=Sphingomonas gilva TaxID=2305907 RepID=A0A396RLF2_9SPHN|nr:transposase domain-containing protein [Sphingomonas gilva]RHW17174.1 hypothetical protein D1610_11535 [Sphingomonas gilva]
MIATGGKQWFTAAELAALALPGLSKAKRKINERATIERWALRVDVDGQPLARPRAGRGGGLEFHIGILPAAARTALVDRGIAMGESAPRPANDARSPGWAWLERQSDKVKAEAQRRMAAIEAIEAHEAAGLTRTAAIALVADRTCAGSSTIWTWLTLIDGVPLADRLPALAPRRAGGGNEVDVEPHIWRTLVSDYLRAERPTFSSCYRRAAEQAKAMGVTLPHQRTLQRRLERDIPPQLVVARREGAEALRAMLPPQQRSVSAMHAMQAVNIDGHRWDVFVRWPDGTIGRPTMVAIQDIYSRKILAWRIAETESAVLTRLAFADLFRDFGIPAECLMDNGRAFASKWISGGAETRFRFKIKEDEPTGLLTGLGIKLHWAQPYRGQSKPIERAFRDLCDAVAKHPAFAGAYTGNRPDAKPENYGEKAVPIDVFRAVVAKGIAAHNARAGRRTEVANGRSFDDVFAESYAASAIGKATPEQMRMALLTGEQLSADRKSGELKIAGNRYWASELADHAGKKLTVRFDPDNLHQAIHVYDRTGRYICAAEPIAPTGFFDMASAKDRARQEKELRRHVREAEQLQDLIAAADLAAMLPDHADEEQLPAPGAVRMVRHQPRGRAAAALKPASEAREAPLNPVIDRLGAALRVVR